MTQQTPDEFGAAFDSFRQSAFRLELLDRYVTANEAEPFRRFLARQPQDPAWREPWTQFVRGARGAGKRIARVHVVSEPLSDYLEFELTCGYPANAAAGEDVRILRLAQYPSLVLPVRDFWMFDDREVAVMDYDGNGNFLGAKMVRDPRTTTVYRRVRDLAMRFSVPLADYLTALGMKEAV